MQVGSFAGEKPAIRQDPGRGPAAARLQGMGIVKNLPEKLPMPLQSEGGKFVWLDNNATTSCQSQFVPAKTGVSYVGSR